MATQMADRGEARSNVMLRASVIDARGTHDARIGDVSERGMLGVMDSPPERGEFITIIFPSQEVAGQVRWVKGRQFGVRLRERLDTRRLFSAANKPRRKGVVMAPADEGANVDLRTTIVSYAVLGVTALATAYLIVTYLP